MFTAQTTRMSKQLTVPVFTFAPPVPILQEVSQPGGQKTTVRLHNEPESTTQVNYPSTDPAAPMLMEEDQQSLPPPIPEDPKILNIMGGSGKPDFSDIDPDDPDIEGKKLVRIFYKQHPLLKFVRDAYNIWANVGIGKQVQRSVGFSDRIKGEPEYAIVFTGARISGFPTVERVDRVTKRTYYEDITPMMARMEGITYSGHLLVSGKIVHVESDQVLSEFKNAKCGSVPIMVGSSLCHLYDRTTGKLKPRNVLMRDYGEGEIDPFTYYITGGSGKGNERNIVFQEKLDTNVVLVYNNNNNNEDIVKMTCNTEKTSSREVYCVYDARDIFTVKMYFLAEYKNNVKSGKITGISFPSIVRIVMRQPKMSWDEILERFVDPLIDPKLRNLARTKLTQTYQAYGNADPYEEVKDIWTKDLSDLTDEQAKKLIYDHIVTDLFPQIDEETDNIELNIPGHGTRTMTTAERRCHNLGLLVSRMILFTLGKITYNNRNDWGNKRLESAGPTLKHLFVQLWAKFCMSLANKLDSQLFTIDGTDEASLSVQRSILKAMSDIAKTEITTKLESNFKGMWGASNKSKKDGVTEVLERENNIMAPIVQLLKTSPPTRSEGKIIDARKMTPSQIGFIGLAETTEGNNCGIVKKLALTALVTIQPSKEDLINVARICSRYCVHPSAYQQGMVTVIVEGKFFGYTDPSTAMALREHRTRGEIPYDCRVHLDIHGVLNVTTVECRMVRPLLVVKDRELVLDQLIKKGVDVWSMTMYELRLAGAIEYLDAKEIQGNHILIARRIADVRNLKNVYRQLYEDTSKILGDIVQDPLDSYRDLREYIPDLLRKINDISEDRREQVRRVTTNIWRNYNANYNYSHCEMATGVTMFSIASALIPFPNHNAAARVSFQSQMSVQAIGVRNPKWIIGNVKTLVHSVRPLVYTDMSKVLGADDNPSGSNVIVAFMSLGGHNQEDAIVINEDFKDMFMTVNYKMYETTKKPNEQMGIHPSLVRRNPRKYAALRPDGLPRIGAYVSDGQYVIGKYVSGKEKTYRDQSVSLSLGNHGVIHDVQYITKGEQEIVRVIVRKTKVPEIGDKFASRYAQKSTVSHYMKNVDMPFISIPGRVWVQEHAAILVDLSPSVNIFIEDPVYDKVKREMRASGNRWLKQGTRVNRNECLMLNFGKNTDESVYAEAYGVVESVEVIQEEDGTERIKMDVRYTGPNRTFPIGMVVSPNAIPTRMTPSKMIEAFIGLSVAITGKRYSADAFRKVNIDVFKDILRDNGYNGYGYQQVYDGKTGKKLKADIFIGVNNYQVLRHQVADKFQTRGAIGLTVESTGQPSGSRNIGGSAKSGYMTTNAAFSSSNPHIVQEICERSDMTTVVVCKSCALIGDPVKGKCGICSGGIVKCRVRSSLIHNFNLMRAAGIDPRLQLGEVMPWEE